MRGRRARCDSTSKTGATTDRAAGVRDRRASRGRPPATTVDRSRRTVERRRAALRCRPDAPTATRCDWPRNPGDRARSGSRRPAPRPMDSQPIGHRPAEDKARAARRAESRDRRRVRKRVHRLQRRRRTIEFDRALPGRRRHPGHQHDRGAGPVPPGCKPAVVTLTACSASRFG